jgi:hypothetical protein
MVKKVKKYSLSKKSSPKVRDINIEDIKFPRFEIPRSEAYEEIQRCLRDLRLMRF